MTLIAPVQKKFTIHRTFFLHAAWLDQISIHCPIFLTAASRRSLDRVSVPVWGTFLSEPLDIVAMVSRYLTIQLMSREPIYNHLSFNYLKMPLNNPMEYQTKFPWIILLLQVCCSRVTHPSAGRRHKYCYSPAAPRLACVKPAASVHPEPGSNSSLYISFYNSLALSCNSSYFFSYTIHLFQNILHLKEFTLFAVFLSLQRISFNMLLVFNLFNELSLKRNIF